MLPRGLPADLALIWETLDQITLCFLKKIASVKERHQNYITDHLLRKCCAGWKHKDCLVICPQFSPNVTTRTGKKKKNQVFSLIKVYKKVKN